MQGTEIEINLGVGCWLGFAENPTHPLKKETMSITLAIGARKADR